MSEGRFLTGSTMGHVVRMTMTGAFGITFVFLVDAMNLFWVSQVGDPQLIAAIGFAFAIQFFSVSSGVGLMIASIAMVSRSIGSGQRAHARTQAGATVVISVIVQAAFSAVVVLLRHDLVAMAGATGETATLAARYLAITVPSLALMAVGMTCSGVLRAEGMGAKAMYVTLTSGAVLMVIDPVLILWMGLGLDGAAIGLVLFRVALMGVGLYFAVWQNNLVARPDLSEVMRVLRPYTIIAVPTIATQLATPAGNYLLTIVIAPFGDDAVAAWAVVGRLTVVAFGGVFALSGAVGGIFGQNYGAGYYERLRTTYRDAMIFCVVYTLVVWALLILTGPYVISAFELSGQGADVVWAFITVGVGGFLFVGALFVSNAAFNNLGKPTRSTLVNWTKEGIISWPAALLLAGFFGAPGVIYGQALAGAIVGLAAVIWGWRYVQSLEGLPQQPIAGADPVRPFPNPDRFRRR
ncbi:MAG: MATE family efflux transporter [Pseudomonadota bacterium]